MIDQQLLILENKHVFITIFTHLHGLFNISLLKSAKATGTQFDVSSSNAMFVYILKENLRGFQPRNMRTSRRR